MFVFRTVVWGAIFSFLALIAGPFIAVQFDGSFPDVALGIWRTLGAPLIVVGLALTLYCAWALFVPGKSRPAPYDAGGAFTIAGPYRFVRNPYMLGILLAAWGEVLVMSLVAMFVYAFLLTWVIHFWVVFYEEPSLQESFGPEYETYRRAVPRWFPKLRRYRG